ncbi:MAG TPA: TolC family protein, partial [Pseudobdellovibrionaceae bacterium]|nr:TolC family protein [Pseudobdellovibrionaceae bacterium]
EALSVAKSNEKPLVNLVARASTSGVDEASSAAYAEMTSMNKPAYYAGLRFSYKFGSGVLDADIRAKRAALSLEETRLKLAKSQQRDQAADAERRVGAAYAIAQSAMKTQEFREKAVNELNRTYNQGRTDIRTLIDNMNQLFNAEVASIRALGDYQIALNEWAALRDELIPDQPKEENK